MTRIAKETQYNVNEVLVNYCIAGNLSVRT